LQHKAICDFPSKQFYDGQLRCANNCHRYQLENSDLPANVWPGGLQNPIVFCDVIDGSETTQPVMTDDASEGSKSNVTEAKYAVSMNRKSEKFQTMPIFGHYVMCELRLNGRGIHFFFISGIRHWECVAPNIDIRLQSG